MTSWSIIKEYFIKNEEIGSIGYFNKINKAAELAIEIMTNLSDSQITQADMNSDDELKKALLMKNKIKNILATNK